MATGDVPTDVTVMDARTAVHEAILLALVIALYRETKDGHEVVQNIMTTITRRFTQAARSAPASERQHAEAAVQVLEHFSEQLLANIPHVSRH